MAVNLAVLVSDVSARADDMLIRVAVCFVLAEFCQSFEKFLMPLDRGNI